MILLVAALAVMTVAVVATVILPLMRGGRAAAAAAEFDRAVYRDQLKELERDQARGLIAAEDAAAARLEIERRLLAADRSGDPQAAPPRRSPSPVLAAALALLLPAAAAVLYLELGAPGVPDEPFAARRSERALASSAGRQEELDRMTVMLRTKIQQNPKDEASWVLLGRTEAALGQWQASADAYREALHLTNGRADIASAFGEMLVAAADGVVTPRAHEAFNAALARDPQDKTARYYLALADAQEGKAQAAIDAWQKLAGEETADSPVRAELKERIADAAQSAGLPVPPLAPPAPAPQTAAPGPNAQDMARAQQMTPEARQQMIRGMVAQLAAKLDANPDDADGWMRLGRAYGVLGEPDKAADAYERAAALKPGDEQVLLAELEAVFTDRAPQKPVPEKVVALLKRIEALDPLQPAALFYLGLASAQQRRFDDARGYWQRLLVELPDGTEQRKAVSTMLDAIKEK